VGIPIPGGELNVSGATWNPETRTLWVVKQDGTFWEIGYDAGADTFMVLRTLALPSGTGGDVESCTQVDFALDDLYTLSESQGRLARTVNLLGTPIVAHVWNLEVSNNGYALPPETPSGDGAEGLAFVPDAALLAAGFRYPNGSSFAGSTRGMGGLIFVGHQVQGRLHVFDVNPAVSEEFVNHGSFLTSANETCGLEFDGSVGYLYLWHNPDSTANTLEISRLTSNVNLGVLDPFVVQDAGMPTGNFEGVAIVSWASCGAYGSGPFERTLFLAQDGGSPNLLAFREFPCAGSPVGVGNPPGGEGVYSAPVVYPNPSNGNPMLAITLHEAGPLKVGLYDVTGRLVRLVANERRAGGTHRFSLGGENARELPAGLYFYRAEMPAGSAHGRVIVLE
jgi:hypothetical protein